MQILAASRTPMPERHDTDVVMVGAGPAGLQVASR